ncbi:MAG: DUF3810 domain-containing protein [Oscillospiraceae bacterium]|nr:DUF3810 domain-containing protein [Oscillospiraceae bacterium]
MSQPSEIHIASTVRQLPYRSRLPGAFRPYRRALFGLLLPFSFLLSGLAATNPYLTELVYSRGIYPVLAGIFGRVFGLFPFSAAEFIVFGGIAVVIGYLAVQIYRMVKRRDVKQRALHILATLCCIGGVVYFLFTALCGLNYHRVTFADQSGLVIRPSSIPELAAVYAELVEKANALRPLVAETQDGVMTLYPDSMFTVARRAPQGFAQLAEHYPVFAGFTPPPKPVLASRGMSWLGIGGVYFPFTFEGNVNVDMPDFNIPFTMLHELAHFKGFMREDEANFIAYIAAREMDDIAFQYSGVVMALIYSGNALFAADRELYRNITAGLYPGVMRDFADNAAYWRQFEGPISEAATAMNDAYLRHNRQLDGVYSYGRMIDLMLADYRQRHGLN